jgi:Tol biopolymer transport system component
MRTNGRILGLLAVATLSVLTRAQETQRINLSYAGNQLSADSGGPVMTPDAHYILFSTAASDVVAGDTNGVSDVFIYDRLSGTTERISVGTGGTESNGDSNGQWMSADGRFVVFASVGDNLVSGDTNQWKDVFVRDRLLGTTERVSVASDGTEADGESFACAISADGRFVSFSSWADNLVSGDTNGYYDVFVHDRQAGTTIRVDVASDGTQADEPSFETSISGDGRYVAFASWATNLGQINQNGQWGYDVFVHDCWTGATRCVSADASNHGGDGDSQFPRISDDGRYIAYQTYARNLLPQYGASAGQILVYETATGATTIASLNSSGQPGTSGWMNVRPTLSPDGRYIAFGSHARNFSQTYANFNGGVYVRDRLLGTVERMSVDSNGVQSDDGAEEGCVSADGRYASFASRSTNLVPGDTNGFTDIFLRDRAPASVASFCLGDGSGLLCPCGNSGGPYRGCQNSATTGGAILWATGHSSLGQDTLQITSFGVRWTTLTILVQGDASISPENHGDGLRCIGGTMTRLYVKMAINGIAISPQGTDASLSVRSAALGDPIQAGATRYYQTYYRDPSDTFCPFPPGGTFNVSNAIAAVWDP